MEDIKKPDQQKLIGNWNAKAPYSPGPSAAKYAGGKRVPCGHNGAAVSDPKIEGSLPAKQADCFAKGEMNVSN